MHVGFLPFISKPITEHSTVLTSMMNFVNIAKQLDQGALPIFCDKGVFRFLADIYLQRKDEFQILFKCLMDFMQPNVLNILLRSIF